ncbi:hypothetical protein B0H19DRAFT_1065799 [Mycena capillaripes]|nr:hypothetical protein B0H19DRAFT_1065799 [Mycena capillaripes]
MTEYQLVNANGEESKAYDAGDYIQVEMKSSLSGRAIGRRSLTVVEGRYDDEAYALKTDSLLEYFRRERTTLGSRTISWNDERIIGRRSYAARDRLDDVKTEGPRHLEPVISSCVAVSGSKYLGLHIEPVRCSTLDSRRFKFLGKTSRHRLRRDANGLLRACPSVDKAGNAPSKTVAISSGVLTCTYLPNACGARGSDGFSICPVSPNQCVYTTSCFDIRYKSLLKYNEHWHRRECNPRSSRRIHQNEWAIIAGGNHRYCRCGIHHDYHYLRHTISTEMTPLAASYHGRRTPFKHTIRLAL